jgi:hypothetical protein
MIAVQWCMIITSVIALVNYLTIRCRVSRAARSTAQAALMAKQYDMIRESMEFGTRPKTLQPWSPAEREAFGVNETDQLIARIDHELKDIEWSRLTSQQRTGLASKPLETDMVFEEVRDWQGHLIRRSQAGVAYTRPIPENAELARRMRRP